MLVERKRVTMFLVPISLLFFLVDANQWLARGCPGQSALGPQTLWSRQSAQAVWGVGCPPWLDVPLGQVLYQSCVLPGGIIWPVWNDRHGSVIMNCEQMTNLYCFQVVWLIMDCLRIFLLGSSSSLNKFIGVMMSRKYKTTTVITCICDLCVFKCILCFCGLWKC